MKCEGLAFSGFRYICNAIYLMNIKHENSIISLSTENTNTKHLQKTDKIPLFYQMTWKEVDDSIIQS